MHIAVCICTYKRPDWLRDLLLALAKQQTNGRFSYSVVIADNDADLSAKSTVEELGRSFPVALAYYSEPIRSIPLVRNRTIYESTGELIALIDDDEIPNSDWLYSLFRLLEDTHCDGVLGPVRPFYTLGTPDWVRRCGLFERPEHPNGYVMPWEKCRSGNVLFRRSVLSNDTEPFRREYASGGSDIDFFRRKVAEGFIFRWCSGAPVLEYVPPSRWKRRVLFNRALLRGKNLMRHKAGRFKHVVVSLAAVPIYTISLPILHLFGHHYFVRYFVKLGDHLGRLLALVGLNPVRDRQM